MLRHCWQSPPRNMRWNLEMQPSTTLATRHSTRRHPKHCWEWRIDLPKRKGGHATWRACRTKRQPHIKAWRVLNPAHQPLKQLCMSDQRFLRPDSISACPGSLCTLQSSMLAQISSTSFQAGNGALSVEVQILQQLLSVILFT